LDIRLAEEILASLPGGGVPFRYFKDRYAVQLLAYAAAEGRSLSELRRGRFRPLLQKPEVRRILGARGGRGVDWGFLDSYFPAPIEDYHLTFGLWGTEGDWRWNQTSRPGINVVVQLNFPLAHDRAYRRYIEPREDHPFEYSCHPINENGRHTLAWSRLDIDLERGEALIEEIQSDWIREAESASDVALRGFGEGELKLPWWLEEAGCDAIRLFRYVEYVLAHHRRIWDQAVLSASLWLLREHLLIRRIYMHTYESGCLLKHLASRRPPRSIYEQVPRTFCFERIVGAPRFLRPQLAESPALSRCEFWSLRV
jgi:hypothetical protein